MKTYTTDRIFAPDSEVYNPYKGEEDGADAIIARNEQLLTSDVICLAKAIIELRREELLPSTDRSLDSIRARLINPLLMLVDALQEAGTTDEMLFDTLFVYPNTLSTLLVEAGARREQRLALSGNA